MGSAAAGPSAITDMVQEWKGMGDSMIKSLMDCVSGIESREKNLRLASDSLVERSRDLEKRERKLEESEFLLERRSEELSFREEKLDEQLRLVREHIEGLEASQGEVERLRREEREKLKEIEKKERELDVVRGLQERELDEVGKKLNAFNTFQNGKLEELASKEELFCKVKREFAKEVQLANEKLKEKEELMCKAKKEFAEEVQLANEKLKEKEKLLCKAKGEFVEEVELANEKLKEKQEMGYDLINRLESTLDLLGGMKVIIDDRLKEIDSRELMDYESLISRLNEADSIQESLEKRFKELEDIEKELHFSQDKTRNFVSNEQLLDTTMVDTVKNGKHDCREQNVSSEREYIQTRAKENPALSKKDQPQAQLVETQIEVGLGEGQQVCRPKEVKLERKLHDVYYEEQGSKQSMLTDTTAGGLATKPDKSADLGHELQEDRKTLEILINGHEKDLELMESEIYKILSQSSDPANLVLYTVQGFYTIRSWKATILLLERLTKMSPNIQHCVTITAVEFAFEWNSKLSACVEDPMETLGFLHFVAAFQISSRFEKNELFNFLKLVGQHKQTPELCVTLDLAFKIPGYIQHLINRKEYLLASTYTHEYQFMNINFKQAAILTNYVANSKKSAIARARKEGNTFEARDNAIVGEIADLLAARVHIIKYGLEGDYSPNVLTARIHQLEADRASLRYGFPSSSAPADIQKQGYQKKKCNARWKNHQSPTGLSYTCAPSTPRPEGPYKRHKRNSLSKGSHWRFGNQY